MSRCTWAHAASVIALAWLAPSSLATAETCTATAEPVLSPAHPGPDDRVAIRLPTDAIPATNGTQVLAVTFVDTATNTIHLDVIVTADARPFPGRRIVNDPAVDAFGYAGPLPAGSYSVTVSVRGYDPDSRTIDSLCDDASEASAATTLVIAPVAAPTTTRAIVEYYNVTLDHYFITQDAAEIQALDNEGAAGWARTGKSFAGYVPHRSDGRGSAAARYYGLPSAGLDTHFFSIRAEHPGPSWILESDDAFELAQPDSSSGECELNATVVPVYRLWNHRPDSNHRYTTDVATKAQMVAQGWLPEGYGPDAVMMCAPAL